MFDYTINDESYKRMASMISAIFNYDMSDYDEKNVSSLKYLRLKTIYFNPYSIPNSSTYMVSLGKRDYSCMDFKKRYPELAECFNNMTFDDCFDLSKNIFNDEIITMAEMIDIH